MKKSFFNSRREFLQKFGIGLFLFGSGNNSFATDRNIAGVEINKNNINWDPYDYGAKGDGRTLDTKAIQATIDDCYSNGGGKVYLHSGTFISGTILLKSNITVYIEAGTTLKGSNNLDDFPIMSSNYPSSDGSFVTNKMLIYAEDAENISIVGRGTIDGNGDHWIDGPYGRPSFSKRPRIIHLRKCNNTIVRDVTLYNSASWVQSYQSCKNMVIDGITVDSRPNKDIEKDRFADAPSRNNDGLDLIDCQQVRIANCHVNSGDDAICLKSDSPEEACRDITITNCVISSNASGIKTGTSSAGRFEDITIQNCVVYDTRGDAIALLTTDGARMERIIVANITLRNIKGAAIAIRLGERNNTYRENAILNTPCITDIIIENIVGTRISYDFGCSVRGVKSIMVQNIILRNINLQFEGGGKAAESYRQIPEVDDGNYPSGRHFGIVPAYGFYIRHAQNVALDNIWLHFSLKDERPALICDDVEQIEIKGLKAPGTMDSPELIRLVDTRDVVISESRPTSSLPVFLSVHGDKSDNIILLNNWLVNAEKNIEIKSKIDNINIEELGTIN